MSGQHPVRPAAAEDLSSWLALAHEVEPLFGPMPGIEGAIRRGTARGTAFVAGPPGALVGAMLLSRDDRPHHIHWLAVTERWRGRGHGSALVRAALRRWPAGDVAVDTFTRDCLDGLPARRLYERSGFVLDGPAEPAPDGSPRDRFVLRRP